MKASLSKLLIIRLSSFGDIIQALPAIAAVKTTFPQSHVHWLVRSDFKGVVEHHPGLDRTVSFDRRAGFAGLLRLSRQLKNENYTHIYDAHNNVRSKTVIALIYLLCLFTLQKPPAVVTRSKNRLKRFLFFKLRLKVFPQPFRGAFSFLEPLEKWGIKAFLPPAPQFFISAPVAQNLEKPFIALVPSAAWPTKRWPLESWKKLVPLLENWNLVILGGPEDTFCEEIAQVDPARVRNWAGTLTLAQSCEVVRQSALTISADTGLLHAADQMGVLNIGLIGPTAFGYTAQPQSEILETTLPCKPCSKDGRDRCVNVIYQKCMKDILPEFVAAKAFEMLEKAKALA